ncbi:alpha/beta hydrolase [Pendulispora brunnea]|uniref:Alpha/beta hydrolase n=1 Tax=Pendulispora brunnea TaxID=2905690 RepID=A0ABZ2JUD8_9BACT
MKLRPLSAVLLFLCAAAASDAPAHAAGTATVLVHYPAGWGHRITLRCGGAGHDWNVALATTWTEGDVWRGSVEASSTIACKPLFDDQHWAIGPNWSVAAGQTIHVWPWFFHDAGRIEQVPNWHSQILGNDRRIWIYYPPSYSENPGERYPVVYMHDGQNLFYDEEAFGGVSWNVGGAMDQGTRNGTIHEAIVVGIDNTANRIGEYTPVPDPDYGGGDAARYVGFVADELKRALDAQLRTLPDAAHTAIVGSSLGGLVSLYAGMERPGVFGNAGALSPSTWWAGEWLIGRSQTAQPPLPARVYIDSGNAGNSNDDVTRTARLAAIWKAKPGISVNYLVQDGATHSEVYWRQRIPGALAFLLGPRA